MIIDKWPQRLAKNKTDLMPKNASCKRWDTLKMQHSWVIGCKRLTLFVHAGPGCPPTNNPHSATNTCGAARPSKLDGITSCIAPVLPDSQHPRRLAEKHPETLVSGFRMHEVTKGKGTEPFPLPAAQKGNPGVSEGLPVQGRC
jgi:hypothetical protein